MSRRILNLNGSNWRLGQAPADARPEGATWDELEQIAEWLPATVPGNIRADLVRAGSLPDPFYGTQAEATQWVDDHCWWLAQDFAHPISPTERMHLVLRGVDYISDLFLNGHHLGRHEGMFSPQVHDVTALLGDENRLAVRITGSRWLPVSRSDLWLRFLNYVESRVASIGKRFPQRRDTLKCQMGFGWDFSPPIRTMGIWDDVYAVVSRNVFLREVAITQQVTRGQAQLTVDVELDAGAGQEAELSCSMVGETFESTTVVARQTVELGPNTSHHTITLLVPQPHLWWPWDHGRPDLYRLEVGVWDGDQILDSSTLSIGLRQVELDGWTLRINGQRVYARGANWVPASILPGCVDGAEYRALLSLARQANMNMLRVWGGGLREKRAFYDLCDRLGILVWQEFPLACAFLTRFPRSPDYLRLIEEEACAIIRDLRNHPSLVLWCGGNEFSPERNAPVVDRLGQVVSREDPTRPFLSASPGHGDSHNWKVWHNFQPASTYREDLALFASEFGLQAVPDRTALERFIPTEELWPPGPSWAYHGAELGKLWRYARPFLYGSEKRSEGTAKSPGRVTPQDGRIGAEGGTPDVPLNRPGDYSDLETFIRASQQAQAHALQIGIEHYRRHKAHRGGGVLIWQLNEPWPAISWALLDHLRQPKPAYSTVKRLFTPLLVSLEYPLKRYQAGDDLACDVWVLNDHHEALDGCRVEVKLWNEAGNLVEQLSLDVDVTANSAVVVGRLRWSLPAGTSWRLTCELHRGGETLTRNEYDLGIHDDSQPTWGQRLWAWLTGLVMPG